MVTFEIDYLAHHTDAIPILARWHQAEWGPITGHLTIEDRASRFLSRARWRMVPTSFVAISGRSVVGVACLVEHDMETRRDLTPWLASVLVAPQHRRSGIGSALTNRVVEEARTLNYQILYLFTFDKVAFYTRLGWAVVEETEYLGLPVSIIARELA